MATVLDPPGAVIGGRYRITGVAGRGAMSTVWRALDETLGRTVALKVIAGELALDPVGRRRFEQEARLTGSLAHPNIVTLYDVGMDHGRPFLVMEYIDGPSLREVLARGVRVPVPLVARVAVDILAGLDAAHRRGIVNRDVKPGNILITSGGIAKLADFGVSKLFDRGPDLTDDGAFVGTERYAAPEQREQTDVGPAADLYSLGRVLEECLARGTPADRGAGGSAARGSVAPGSPKEEESLVPAPMREAIDRSLIAAPLERFTSAGAMRSPFLPFAASDLSKLVLDEDTEPGTGSRLGATDGPLFTDATSAGVTPPFDGKEQKARVPPHRHRRLAASVSVVIAAILCMAAAAALVGVRHRGSTASGSATRLVAGDTITPGESVFSPNRRIGLEMQANGELVVRLVGRDIVLWSSGSQAAPGAHAVLQSDGDFAVYPKGASAPAPGAPTPATWSTGTGGDPGAVLAVQNDGNVVLYDASGGTPLWDTGTETGAIGPILLSGRSLLPGQFLQSPDGRFRLVDNASTGQLQLTGGSSIGCLSWEVPAVSGPPVRANMESDGQLSVATNDAPGVEWRSDTPGNPGAFLVLENSGSLIVSSPAGFTLWSEAPSARHKC